MPFCRLSCHWGQHRRAGGTMPVEAPDSHAFRFAGRRALGVRKEGFHGTAPAPSHSPGRRHRDRLMRFRQASTSPERTGAATPTPSPTTVPAKVQRAIIHDYEAGWNVVFTSSDPPKPDDARLAQHLSGEFLGQLTETLNNDGAAGTVGAVPRSFGSNRSEPERQAQPSAIAPPTAGSFTRQLATASASLKACGLRTPLDRGFGWSRSSKTWVCGKSTSLTRRLCSNAAVRSRTNRKSSTRGDMTSEYSSPSFRANTLSPGILG